MTTAVDLFLASVEDPKDTARIDAWISFVKSNWDTPIRVQELGRLGEAVLALADFAIGAPLAGRISALEIRLRGLEAELAGARDTIKALEARPRGLVFKGAWDARETYEIGDGVQHNNSTWGRVSVTSRTARPGESRDWLLSAKAGRDGKDAR